MANTTYVGVTRLRYLQRTEDKGRTYYYFRRRRFPIVRLPGEPGSELFTTVYNSALAASTNQQFVALRSNMKQMRPRKVDSPLTTAILTWANQKPITYLQASMVAKRFGVSIEDVVRGRQVVDSPENEALADPKITKALAKSSLKKASQAAATRHSQFQALPLHLTRGLHAGSISSMLVGKTPESAPLCPQCGDAMRLARKFPPVRPLSGLVVHLCGGCGYVEPPNASPIPHHRSGFDRRAAYDIPCSARERQ